MLVNISQEEMGEFLGLTFQQVQKYEKGTNRISASRLYEIAQHLTVPITYFYEGLPDSGDAAQPDMTHLAHPDVITFARLRESAPPEVMRFILRGMKTEARAKESSST